MVANAAGSLLGHVLATVDAEAAILDLVLAWLVNVYERGAAWVRKSKNGWQKTNPLLWTTSPTSMRHRTTRPSASDSNSAGYVLRTLRSSPKRLPSTVEEV